MFSVELLIIILMIINNNYYFPSISLFNYFKKILYVLYIKINFIYQSIFIFKEYINNER